MSKFSYILLVLLLMLASPQVVLAAAEASFALDVISIPDEQEPAQLAFDKVRVALLDTFPAMNIDKKNNNKNKNLCSLNKSFGPLDLGLNVSPLNITNTGLVVGLDLLRSYEIFSSSHNITEVADAFRPKADQYILKPEIRSILRWALISINDITSSEDSVLEVQ